MRLVMVLLVLGTIGCGMGVGRVHLSPRPRYRSSSSTPIDVVGYTATGPAGTKGTCYDRDGRPYECDATPSGTKSTSLERVESYDSDRFAFGFAFSAALGLGTARLGDTETSTRPLRLETQLGYFQLGRRFGIAGTLGWQRADYAPLLPDAAIPPGPGAFDLGAHLGVGISKLTFDVGAGYSFLADNGPRWSGSIAYATPKRTVWAFDQVMPRISVDRTSVGFGASEIVTTSVLFQLVLAAPSALGTTSAVGVR